MANLAEFATGGNPFVADASSAMVQSVRSVSGMFGLQFQERKNPGNVQYRFERSSDLMNWMEVTPSSVVTVANLMQVYVKEAKFVMQNGSYFYRIRYLQSEM